MDNFSQSHLVWLIPGLPLLGFFIHAFIGKKLPRGVVGGIATLVVLASFAVSVWVLIALLGQEERRAWASLIPGVDNVPWIDIGKFQVYYRALIDPLSMLMCLIVTGVGGLIHLYATGYMAEDKDYSRFFTYLNLFIFFMLMLVLGENILLMFVGWEGVGLCSYLLISFWFEDVENSKAGNKAFIVNRVGDVGFGLGIMAIFAAFGTLTFYAVDGQSGFLDMAVKGITASGPLDWTIATLIGLLLFIGAMGKSAQVPLHIWLPDAMAGPTPVSALIHAATMVTAGVVMITRVSPLIVHSPYTMTIIAGIGIFTAIFAASIALTQNDIKKVLAYSTVSQLGYMFVGCGVGAFSAGMFHVTTHAFFKALLFLGAGSVIHALSGEQDMRKMGGLAKRIPITYWTMFAGWIAISGIPPFAGFWSKDEILGAASGYRPRGFESIGMAIYIVGIITAFMTAFYMTRLMAKTFWTKQRFVEGEIGTHGHGDTVALAHEADQYHDQAVTHGAESSVEHEEHSSSSGAHDHGTSHGVHESPPSMWIPLAILAVLSVVGGFLNLPEGLGLPGAGMLHHFLEPSVGKAPVGHAFPVAIGLGIGFAVALLGVLLARSLYTKNNETGELAPMALKEKNPVYRGAQNLWFWDKGTYDLFVTSGGRFANGVWNIVDRGIVDGSVKALAFMTGFFSEVFRRVQTGYVRNYALMMLMGVVAVVGGLLIGYLGR